ncbi:MAG: hypothetical protein IT371_07390 [Deltaproteobacteria bacterium]|nr:hypothetical protein [Deltaproteobacteria bacterium]
MTRPACACLAACFFVACHSATPGVGGDGGPADGGALEAGSVSDGSGGELGSRDDAGANDGAQEASPERDLGGAGDYFVWDGRSAGADLAGRRDVGSARDAAGKRDVGPSPDAAVRRDLTSAPDAAVRRDVGPSPDAAPRRDSGSVATPPCVTGQGVAAYRFHFGPSGTYATLDAWGLRSTAWWEVVPVWADSQLVDQNQSLHLGSSSAYVRVRWSFDGIQSFTKGSLCIQARSYSTGTSSKFRPWSPIHGDTVSGLVSVYPYAWYCVDWTNFMSVNDQAGLLGYRLYPDSYGAASLAIHAVELCLQGVVYK